ncbi:MAG: MoaD/ThiS family protein [Pseudomonadota bacterium]
MTEKNLTVRYFAYFRDLAGTSEERVALAAATTGDLFDALRERLSFDEPRQHCKVAVNDVLTDWQHSLADGDTVLLFPPVAGG